MDEEADDEAKKAKEKGNIQIHDEFGKAKRNLLWFCCISILLWMVPSVNGEFQAPFLGVGAKVSALGLRFVIWIAAAYCLVGFWRQARNVDRINSTVLYTEQFDNLETRLTKLGTTFGTLAEQCERLSSTTAPVHFSNPPNLEAARTAILKGINEALARVNELIQFGASDPKAVNAESRGTLLRQFNEAKNGLELAVNQPFNTLQSSNKEIYDELVGIRNVAAQAFAVSKAILDIRMGFQSLNEQIRGEHLWMYRLYDKSVTYAFFGLATLATFAEQLGLGYGQISQFTQQISFSAIGSTLGTIVIVLFAIITGGGMLIVFGSILTHAIRRRALLKRLEARNAPEEEIAKFRAIPWNSLDVLETQEVHAALKAEQLRDGAAQEKSEESVDKVQNELGRLVDKN